MAYVFECPKCCHKFVGPPMDQDVICPKCGKLVEPADTPAAPKEQL